MTQLRVVPGGLANAAVEADRDAGPQSDRAMLARVVERDQAAHRVIFERYYKRVLAFVRRRVGDDGLAEEVTTDVFFEVWRNAAAYRGESPVTTWIFGIANLKALSARRYFAQPRRASVRVDGRRGALALPRSGQPGRRRSARARSSRASCARSSGCPKDTATCCGSPSSRAAPIPRSRSSSTSPKPT